MVKSKKIGGIRFLTIGRLNVSYSFKRKVKRSSIYTLDGVQYIETGVGIFFGAIGSITLLALFA
jgi:hypothetical protein